MSDIDFSKCPCKNLPYQKVSCKGCMFALPFELSFDGNICALSKTFQVFHHDDFLDFINYQQQHYVMPMF